MGSGARWSDDPRGSIWTSRESRVSARRRLAKRVQSHRRVGQRRAGFIVFDALRRRAAEFVRPDSRYSQIHDAVVLNMDDVSHLPSQRVGASSTCGNGGRRKDSRCRRSRRLARPRQRRRRRALRRRPLRIHQPCTGCAGWRASELPEKQVVRRTVFGRTRGSFRSIRGIRRFVLREIHRLRKTRVLGGAGLPALHFRLVMRLASATEVLRPVSGEPSCKGNLRC
jgi:hypothetical protein